MLFNDKFCFLYLEAILTAIYLNALEYRKLSSAVESLKEETFSVFCTLPLPQDKDEQVEWQH